MMECSVYREFLKNPTSHECVPKLELQFLSFFFFSITVGTSEIDETSLNPDSATCPLHELGQVISFL